MYSDHSHGSVSTSTELFCLGFHKHAKADCSITIKSAGGNIDQQNILLRTERCLTHRLDDTAYSAPNIPRVL